TATSSPTGGSTSARSSTTCGPPSSWPSTATTSARSSPPSWPISCAGGGCSERPAGERRTPGPGPRRRGGGGPMIPLDEAVATVLAGCTPLPAEPTPLGDALGRVLAADVSAPEAVPPFANTAMDGYAVRASDVAAAPVRLPVVA